MNKLRILLVSAIIAIFALNLYALPVLDFREFAKNSSGALVLNTALYEVNIQIQNGTTVIYEETYTAAGGNQISTDEFGIFRVNIGTGTVVSGTYSTITMSTNLYVYCRIKVNSGDPYRVISRVRVYDVAYRASVGVGNTVETGEITDGTIIDDDISATAAIQVSKLAGGSVGDFLVTGVGGTPTWSSFPPSGAINVSAPIIGDGTAGNPITLDYDATLQVSGGQLGLPNTGVTAGTYGGATLVPQISVDAQGRITSASDVAISFPAETDPVWTAAEPNYGNLTQDETVTGNWTFSNTITGSISGNAGTATALQTARNFSIGGDATGGPVSFDGTGDVNISINLGADVVGPTELASTTVTAGTYGDGTNVAQFTVDADGRITNATNVPISFPAETDPIYTAVIPNIVFDGDPAGGDLTGTYPNPTIATNAVTTAKIADGTILPADADLTATWNFTGSLQQGGDNVLTTATNFGGDVSGTYNNIQLGSGVVTGSELEDLVPSPAGTYGNGTNVAQVTVDANGRVTAATNVAISFPAETDPEVNMTTTNAVPRWNGTSLVDGSMTDDGTKVSINATISSDLVPTTPNTFDLGAVGNEWRDLYFENLYGTGIATFNNGTNGSIEIYPDGVAYFYDTIPLQTIIINGNSGNVSALSFTQNGNAVLDVTTAFAGDVTGTIGATVVGDDSHNHTDATIADALTINNGTIDNTVIGGTTPAAGTFTNLQINGTLNDGSSAGTTGQVLAVAGDGTPQWTTLSTLETDPVWTAAKTTNATTITPNWTFDGNLTANGTLTANGNVTLGSDAADNVVFNALVNSNILPASVSYNLGSLSNQWSNIYLIGNVYVQGNIEDPIGTTVSVNDNFSVTGTTTITGALTGSTGTFTGDIQANNGSGNFGNGTSDPDIYAQGNLEVDGNLYIGDNNTTDQIQVQALVVPFSNTEPAFQINDQTLSGFDDYLLNVVGTTSSNSRAANFENNSSSYPTVNITNNAGGTALFIDNSPATTPGPAIRVFAGTNVWSYYDFNISVEGTTTLYDGYTVFHVYGAGSNTTITLPSGQDGQVIYVYWDDTNNATFNGVNPDGSNYTTNGKATLIFAYINGGWRLVSVVE